MYAGYDRRRWWFVILLLSTVTSVVVSASKQSKTSPCHPCPNTCTCRKTSKDRCTVNCTALGLTEFPDSESLPKEVDVIDVSSNNLTTINENAFDGHRNLKYIDISSNPLNCNCELVWLLKTLKGSKISAIGRDDGKNTTCDIPTHLKGKDFLQLSEEDLQCVANDPVAEEDISFLSRSMFLINETANLTIGPHWAGSHYEWTFGDGSAAFVTSQPFVAYKFLAPGEYNVSLSILTSTTTRSVHTLVRIVTPVDGLTLTCPQSAQDGGPLNIKLSMQSGSDVSIIWELKTNNSHTDEMTTTSVPVKLAGIIPLDGRHHSYQNLDQASSKRTANEKIVLLFPGLWFQHLGSLKWWEFLTHNHTVSQQINLQVYRPSCKAGLKMVPPGCDENPFPECKPSSKSCHNDIPVECSPMSQYCPLNHQCVSIFAPCNCMSSNGTCAASAVADWISSVDRPHLTMIGQTAVEVKPSIGIVNRVTPREGIPVEPNDFIGVQLDKGDVFMKCETNSSDDWTQSVLSGSSSDWFSTGDIIDTSSFDWLHHFTCYIRAAFSQPVTSKIPASLAKVANAKWVAYQVTASNNLTSQVATCNVSLADNIGGLRLVHPTNILTRLTTISNGTIIFELNVNTSLLISISAGMPASVCWDSGQLTTSSMQVDCPSDFSKLHQCQNSTGTFYAYKTFLFNNIINATVFSVNVSNSHSYEHLIFDYMVQQRITNVTIERVLTGPYKVQNNESFLATCTGSHILYEWMIQPGSVSLQSSSPIFSYTFLTAGAYKLSVRASNDINAVLCDIVITVPKPDGVKNVKLNIQTSHIAKDNVFNFSLSFEAPLPSEVNIVLDYGDMSLPLSQFINTSNVLTTLTYIHVYERVGSYCINATVVKRSSTPFPVVNISCINVLPTLRNLNIVTSHLVSTTEIVEFRAILENGTMPNMTYEWDFDDSSSTQLTKTNVALYQFKLTGRHNVSVTASTRVSALKAFVVITVQKPIVGLQLFYNGPTILGDTTVVSAHVAAGSDILYEYFYDSQIVRGASTLDNFHYVFTRTGNYNISVQASNNISMSSAWLMAYVIDSSSFEIVGINLPSCVPVQTTLNITVNVIHVNSSSLMYNWTLADSRNICGKGLITILHTFTSHGNVLVHVAVTDGVQTIESNTTVCVQEPVGEVVFQNHPSALSLPHHDRDVSQTFAILLTTGSNFTTTWIIDGKVELIETLGLHHEIVFNSTGKYVIKAIIENDISSNNVSTNISVDEPISSVHVTHNAPDNLVVVGYTYTYMAQCPYGTDIMFVWNFGDSLINQTGQTQTHTFSSSGNYSVIVAAINSVSRFETAVIMIAQTAITSIVVSSNTTVVEANGTVGFTVTVSTGSDIRYKWRLCETCSTIVTSDRELYHQFVRSGEYTVSVAAFNAISYMNTTIKITVLIPVEGLSILANLTRNKFVALNEHTVFKSQLIHGNGVKYEWIIYEHENQVFHNISEHLNYIFLNEGLFEVVLIASNSLNQENVSMKVVVLDKLKGFRIGTQSPAVKTGAFVQFSGLHDKGFNITVLWHIYKDGVTISNSTGLTFTYVFTSVGVYNIQADAKDIFTSVTCEKEIYVQDPVRRIFIKLLEDTSPFIAKDKSILYSSVVDHGSMLFYKWQFKDVFYTQENVTHLFNNVGAQTVWLTVFNNVSELTTNMTLYVEEAIQGVQIQSNPPSAPILTDVHFVASATSGTNMSYEWNFGDGSILHESAGQVIHQFTSVGVYNVTLTTVNNISSDFTSVTVIIDEVIKGLQILDCCDTVLPTATLITFYSKVQSGHVITYIWRVEDNNGILLATSHGQNFSHVFLTAGNNQLTVTACGPSMCTNVSVEVIVQTEIKTLDVRSSEDINKIYPSINVSFEADIVHGSDVQYTWTINDVFKLTGRVISWTFDKDGEYQLQVVTSNNISSLTKTVTLQVLDSNCVEPRIKIDGDSKRQLRMSNQIQIEAIIDFGICNSLQVSYQWTVYQTPSCSTLLTKHVLPSTIRTNLPSLIIPSSVLDVGTYCLTLDVAYKKTSVKAMESIEVSVVASDLVPVISGGSERTTPIDQHLILDASQSYDPDDSSAVLTFTWSCSLVISASTQTTQPISTRSCSVPSHGMEVIINANNLISDTKYIFSVTVGKAGKSNVTASQTVIVLPPKVPKVRVECFSCSVSRSYKISASSHIALEGHCDNYEKDEIRYHWSATKDDSTPVTLDSKTTKTGADKQNLVIRKGVLDDGHDHTFKLTISIRGSNLSSYASILLVANPPPYGGVCDVNPTLVVALETKVNVSCRDWQDDDAVYAPLLYEISAISDSDGKQDKYILYHGTQSSKEVYLSTWPGASENVQLVVNIQDPLGARTQGVSRLIQVDDPVPPLNQTKTEFLVERSQKDLQYLVKKNDPNSLLQYSIALLLQLNNQSKMAERGDNPSQDNKRTLVRDTVTEAINKVAILSSQDIQQMSFLLDKLTGFAKELQNRSGQALILDTLQIITDLLLTSSAQGADSSEMLPNDLLAAIVNLIEAVNLQVQLSGERSDKTGLNLYSVQEQTHRTNVIGVILKEAENLLTVALMSQILNEEPISLNISGFKVKGQRTIVSDIWQKETQDGCQFVISESAVKEHYDVEILQIIYVLNKNPFTWGFYEDQEVTSRVAALSFRFGNGTKISVDKLPHDKRIKIIMTSTKQSDPNIQQSSLVNSVVNSPGYDPTSGVQYVSTELQPLKAKKGMLNTSMSSSNTAMHVQIRCSGHNGVVTALLGKNYVPSASQYDSKLEITPALMVKGQDHRKFTFFESQKSFDKNSKYYITVTNKHDSMAASVSVGVYFSTCVYYNEDGSRWDTSGCEPDAESVTTATVCSCNHLTSFGAMVLVPPDAIDFTDLEDLDLAQNPVVLITVSVVASLYIIAVIFARRWDLEDMRNISVLPLCGKEGNYKYEVTMVTGRQLGAGTSAHIGIRVYGTNTKSLPIHLSKAKAFQRNSQDVFLIGCNEQIQDIRYIRVWHDNAGLDPDWFLRHVSIEDLQTGKQWFFKVDKWFSLYDEHGSIEKEIIPSGQEQLCTFSSIFHMERQAGFANKHIWLSVWERSPYSRFSRVQRITCCVTLLYSFMCLNAAWYGILKTQTRTGHWFSWEEVVVGILSSLTVLPISVLLVAIFKRSKHQLMPFDYTGKPPSAETVEMENMISQHSSFGYHNQTEEKLNLENTDMGVPLNRLKRSNPLTLRDGSIMSREMSDISNHSHDSPQTCGSTSKPWWSHDNILKWPERLPSWKEATMLSLRGRMSISVHPTIEETSRDIEDTSKHIEVTSRRHRTRKERFSLPTDLSSASSQDLKSDSVNNNNPSGKTHRLDEKRASIASSIHQCTWEDISKPADDVKTSDDIKTDHELNKPRDRVPKRQDTQDSVFSESLLNLGKKRVRQHTLDSCYSGMSNATFMSGNSDTGSAWEHQGTLGLHSAPPMSYGQLPHWFVYVAYTLCLLLSSLCVVVTILYGHMFGPDIALRWLAAFAIAFIQSAVVIEPFKVILLAVIVATSTKDKYAPEKSDDLVSLMPTIESNEKIKEVKIRPVAGYSLMQARQEASKVRRMHLLLRQAVVYLLFFWLIVAICLINQDDYAYYQNKAVRDSLRRTNGSFEHIHSLGTFWQEIEERLIPGLYGDMSTDAHLLGTVRLLQVRNHHDSCVSMTSMTGVPANSLSSTGCYGDGSFDEDVVSYGEEWSSSIHGNQSWQHFTASALGRRHHYGELNSYSGGGYVQVLGPTLNDMRQQVNHLMKTNWIDARTRMVTVEYTLLNINLDMFTVVSLITEFPFSGGAVSRYDITSASLPRFSKNYVTVLMVCEVVVMVISLYLLIKGSVGVYHQRASYFLYIWNIIELCQALVAMSTIALYIYNLFTNTLTLQTYLDNKDTFIAFTDNVYHQQVFIQLNAVILFLLLLKVVHQLRFIRRLSVFGKTISAALTKLLGCLLIVLLLVIAYSCFGYLLFNSCFHEFHDFRTSFLTVAHIIQGHVRYDKFEEVSPIWSRIYFLSGTVILYGVGCCLVAAVLIDTYTVTKLQMYYHTTLEVEDYEMIEFMVKRFKLWAGIDQPKPAFRKVKFQGLPSLSTVSSQSSSSGRGSTCSSTHSSDMERLDSSLSHTSLMDKLLPTWEQLLDKFEQVTTLDNQVTHLQCRIQQEVQINDKNRTKGQLFTLIFCGNMSQSLDTAQSEPPHEASNNSHSQHSRQNSTFSKQSSIISSRQSSVISSRSNRIHPTHVRAGSNASARKLRRSASDCHQTLQPLIKSRRDKRFSLTPPTKNTVHFEMEKKLRPHSDGRDRVRAEAVLTKSAW